MRRQDELKAEHKAPITADLYIPRKLLSGTDSKVLLNTGAGKSFISKTFFQTVNYYILLLNFGSKTKNILVGNAQYVGVSFIVPVVIDLQRHRFEVYTFVSEIHDNLGMVKGIKNIYEIEGVISTRDSCLHFLNRSIPFFHKTDVLLKTMEQRFTKIN